MSYVNGNGDVVDIGADPSDIEQAVTDWLDDHPDATTTVTDGSLTTSKLSQSAYMQVGDLTDIGRMIINGTITKIDFIGNSVVAGVGGTGYDGNHLAPSPNSTGYCFTNVMRKYLAEKYGCTVVNQGMSGASIEDIEVYMNTIFSTGSQCAIYFADINDRNSSAEWNTFMSHLPGFITTALGKVKYFAVIPQYPTRSDLAVSSSDADAFIAGATMERCYYGSLRKKWLDYITIHGLTTLALTADAYHPNDLGYYHMWKMVCEMLGIPYDPSTDYSVNGDWWVS